MFCCSADSVVRSLKVRFTGFVAGTTFLRTWLHPTAETYANLYLSGLFYGVGQMITHARTSTVGERKSIRPSPDIDAFMKATSVDGKKHSISTGDQTKRVTSDFLSVKSWYIQQLVANMFLVISEFLVTYICSLVSST